MDDVNFVAAVSHAVDFQCLDGQLTLADPAPALPINLARYTQLERLGFDPSRTQELVGASRYAVAQPELDLSFPFPSPGFDQYEIAFSWLLYRSWFLGHIAGGNHAAAPVRGESASRTAAGVRFSRSTVFLDT